MPAADRLDLVPQPSPATAAGGCAARPRRSTRVRYHPVESHRGAAGRSTPAGRSASRTSPPASPSDARRPRATNGACVRAYRATSPSSAFSGRLQEHLRHAQRRRKVQARRDSARRLRSGSSGPRRRCASRRPAASGRGRRANPRHHPASRPGRESRPWRGLRRAAGGHAAGLRSAPCGFGQSLQLQLECVQRVGSSSSRSSSSPSRSRSSVAVQRQRLRVAARPAARRPRTCRPRCSRTAERANGDASWSRPSRADLVRLRTCERISCEARQVEHIPQALAVGLEDDRERLRSGSRRRADSDALPLQPQGRPSARPPPREEQRPRRVLPEVRGEHRRVRQRPTTSSSTSSGDGKSAASSADLVAAREPQSDAVVAPERLDVEPAPLLKAMARSPAPTAHVRAPPNGVRITTRQSPSSSLKPFDDDRPVRRAVRRSPRSPLPMYASRLRAASSSRS